MESLETVGNILWHQYVHVSFVVIPLQGEAAVIFFRSNLLLLYNVIQGTDRGGQHPLLRNVLRQSRQRRHRISWVEFRVATFRPFLLLACIRIVQDCR